jgi:hypothetical protein
LGAVVNVRAVVNVEDVYNSTALVDPVDDAICASPGAVAASERPEQRFADPVRVARKPGIAKLEHSGGNSFRKPMGDRSPCGRLKPDLVPLRRFGRHAPVARRRARSWRTVAMSAPGSPRPKAARLSEIRATDSESPRISRVISMPSRSSTDSKTASASPLRVRVMRSCCCRTRLASSERRALASDNGTAVAAIVIVRIIDPNGQTLDQPSACRHKARGKRAPAGTLAVTVKWSEGRSLRRDETMSKAIMGAVVSLDGFMADDNDT